MNRTSIIRLFFLALVAALVGIYYFQNSTLRSLWFGNSYTKQDLIENFEMKKMEILEVKSFVSSKSPKDSYFNIEFEDGEIALFHVGHNGIQQNNWDLDFESKKVDSILAVFNWTRDDLHLLQQKLNAANCISVKSGNPTVIGWQRSGMGMYSYAIFNQNLSDSLINRYNDSCIYLFYRDNIVLEYGSGAIGSICFPDKDTKE